MCIRDRLMADNTIAENRDEGSFIWENYYDADEKINESVSYTHLDVYKRQ